MKTIIPNKEYESFIKSLSEDEQTTSIRINKAKSTIEELIERFEETAPVPWCEEGLYLKNRPQFTLDPLLHSGAYYVQEASSMFITNVIKNLVKDPDGKQ